MVEDSVNEMNVDLSGVSYVAGCSYYCHNEVANTHKTVGSFYLNSAVDANYIQIKVSFAPGDNSNYVLAYNYNGQAASFVFTPQKVFLIKSGPVNHFNCQLIVTANNGNPETQFTVAILKL